MPWHRLRRTPSRHCRARPTQMRGRWICQSRRCVARAWKSVRGDSIGLSTRLHRLRSIARGTRWLAVAAWSRGTRIQGVTTMDIDCPECGRRIELNQSGIIPYHDNGSPIVCAGPGRQVSAASTQPRCTWCDAPAVCIATSEGDPYMFACDEHCGHGDEEGAHAFLSDPAAMLAIINGLHARVAELVALFELACAEEREACALEAEKHAFVARGSGSPRAKHDEALVIADAIRARSNT